MNVPVIMQRRCFWSAVHRSTVDTNSATAWETFGRISGFLREWYTLLLRSILVLLFPVPVCVAMRKWPRSSSTLAVAYFLLVLLVKMHLALCPDDRLHAEWRSVHSFCFGRLFSLEIWTLFLRTPCFAVLSAVRGLR